MAGEEVFQYLLESGYIGVRLVEQATIDQEESDFPQIDISPSLCSVCSRLTVRCLELIRPSPAGPESWNAERDRSAARPFVALYRFSRDIRYRRAARELQRVQLVKNGYRSLFRSARDAGFPIMLGIAVLGYWLTTTGCREVASRLDEYLQKAEEVWQFSGAVMVAVDGRVILSRAYGLANVVFEEPNTPTTKFYIGSITKTFTAAAIMKLREDGRLALDDPITKYLPSYPADPGDRTTIEQLLAHTSGLTNYTDHPEIAFKRERPMTPSELVDFFKNRPLLFEPGTGFHYSNSNYVLLGEIIEAVSGQSYEAFLHHKLLKPLGMLDSGYGRREAAHPMRADGYTLDLDRDYVEAVPVHLSVLYAAGALYSTAEDLLKWDQGLYGESVLARASIETMLAPHAAGYGYGWAVDTLYGRDYVYHGGFLDGFNCTMDRWLDDRLCVIVLSNEDLAPVRKMAQSLAAICFGQPYSEPVRKEPIPLDVDRLAEYVGAYQVCPGAVRLITAIERKLYAQVEEFAPEGLQPESVDVFYFEDDPTRTLTFVRDSTGKVVSQILFDNERRFRADLLPPLPDQELLPRPVSLADTLLDAYCGVYNLESELPVEDPNYRLYVTREGERLFIAVGDMTPVMIVPSGPDEFFHGSAEYRIVFERDASGKISGCELRMGGSRVRGVRTE